MSLLALRLLGGDLAMLQVVAWTGMIVTRTADRGVAAAVQSTLDGDEPCPLCKAIKAAREAEQEKPQPLSPDSLLSKLKLKDMLRSEDLVLTAPPADVASSAPAPAHQLGRHLTRSDAPLVPPPRHA
jgi:hypothetical protein